MFLWIALQLKRKMLIGLCELSPVELGYAQLNWVELSIWQSISGILKKQYLKKYTYLANLKKISILKLPIFKKICCLDLFKAVFN